jgi:Flp pilus assembly protein TadG
MRAVEFARRIAADLRGGAAVEYALVLPVFVLLVLGCMGAASYGYSLAAMNYTVEETARCAAVKTTVCSNSTSIALYAKNHYSGPAISPVFTYSTAGCGNTVTATATYSFNLVPQFKNVPISVSACRPSA